MNTDQLDFQFEITDIEILQDRGSDVLNDFQADFDGDFGGLTVPVLTQDIALNDFDFNFDLDSGLNPAPTNTAPNTCDLGQDLGFGLNPPCFDNFDQNEDTHGNWNADVDCNFHLPKNDASPGHPNDTQFGSASLTESSSTEPHQPYDEQLFEDLQLNFQADFDLNSTDIQNMLLEGLTGQNALEFGSHTHPLDLEGISTSDYRKKTDGMLGDLLVELRGSGSDIDQKFSELQNEMDLPGFDFDTNFVNFGEDRSSTSQPDYQLESQPESPKSLSDSAESGLPKKRKSVGVQALIKSREKTSLQRDSGSKLSSEDDKRNKSKKIDKPLPMKPVKPVDKKKKGTQFELEYVDPDVEKCMEMGEDPFLENSRTTFRENEFAQIDGSGSKKTELAGSIAAKNLARRVSKQKAVTVGSGRTGVPKPEAVAPSSAGADWNFLSSLDDIEISPFQTQPNKVETTANGSPEDPTSTHLRPRPIVTKAILAQSPTNERAPFPPRRGPGLAHENPKCAEADPSNKSPFVPRIYSQRTDTTSDPSRATSPPRKSDRDRPLSPRVPISPRGSNQASGVSPSTSPRRGETPIPRLNQRPNLTGRQPTVSPFGDKDPSTKKLSKAFYNNNAPSLPPAPESPGGGRKTDFSRQPTDSFDFNSNFSPISAKPELKKQSTDNFDFQFDLGDMTAPVTPPLVKRPSLARRPGALRNQSSDNFDFQPDLDDRYKSPVQNFSPKSMMPKPSPFKNQSVASPKPVLTKQPTENFDFQFDFDLPTTPSAPPVDEFEFHLDTSFVAPLPNQDLNLDFEIPDFEFS